MGLTVGIAAAGQMGAGIGRVLAEGGARVLAPLAGRSAATIERAAAAGIDDATPETLARCDIVLSILPPGEARTFATDIAERVSPDRPPVFVEFNAITPALTQEIGAIVTAAGGHFLDGSIIGAPPSPEKTPPRLYVSGPGADALAPLSALGLDIRPLDAQIGTASALKMCYGGLTKGLTGLQAALILAAERADIGAPLRAELADSQPALLARARSGIPAMYPKAYRWVAEMECISEFVGSELPESAIWDGIAGLYRRLAEDAAGSGGEIDMIDRFLAGKP